ncbi:hypothetical protein [Deinococcus puniceus]|nr:hypothetical protein [Deinococcus puniceus]
MKPKIKAVLFLLTAALTIAGGSMSANLTANTAPDKAPTQDGSRGTWAS